MTSKIETGARISRLKRTLLGSCCVAVVGTAAIAQVGDFNDDPPLRMTTDYFGYSAGVSAQVGYSDNINLAPDGFEEDEFIVSSAFTAGAIFSKPRITGVILGDLDFSYLTEQDDFVINQDIGLASTFEAVEDWLYLDVAGQTSRQLLGDNARFSGNLNAARGQRANVHSYTVSPYVYREMPSQSAVELRYRFSQTLIDDGDSDANPSGRDLLNNSRSHEAVASFETGNLFQRVRFRTGLYGNRTIEDGSDIFDRFEYQQGAVFAEAQLALNQRFSLSGAVGYDEVETSGAASMFFNDDDLSGVFWRAGFTATPNRRSNVRIEYGQRYGDDFVDASINYQISPRFTFAAGANRSFQTRSEANSDYFQDVQRNVLDFADRLREGDELSARDVVERANRFADGFGFGNTSQTIGLGTTDSAFAGLYGNYDRTQVSATGFYYDTDFGFRENTTYGGSLNLDRQLTRRLTGYGGIAFRRVDTSVDQASCEAGPEFFGIDTSVPMFDAVAACTALVAVNGVTNTLIGSIGASYSLYENVSLFAEYAHTERFSEVDALEYDENSVVAGLTLEF